MTSGRHPLWLLLALILVALNLRPALTSLAPLLRAVQGAMGLSASTAGLLTTLPILCLGLFAPLAPRLAQRFGSEKTVLAVLLLLAAGIVLRSLGGASGLFAGTLIAGAGIGIIGVLLPGMVKRDFPEKAGMVTGIYSMALCTGAAAAAGLTVPLRDFFHDWRPALAFWALPAVIAALVWWPQQRRAATHLVATAHADASLWRDRLAWQVTLFMGLQSALAYCVFGWLPTILQDRGITPLLSGLYLSVSVMMQVLSSLAAPWLASRHRDQSAMAMTMLLLTFTGLMGCLFAPVTTLWWWVVILGLGQGGGFGMALAFIVLRSPDAGTAARLSGMVQGVGYSVASLGPLLVGVLHEATGNWNTLGGLFALIIAGALIAGRAAGRNRFVLGQ